MDNGNNVNAYLDNEKEIVAQIIKEISTGKTDTLNEILSEDYEEIPVDIDTFLTDRQYLGNFTDGGKELTYREWPEAFREWFPNPLTPSPYIEIALTGAIGLGKSTNADYALTYQLYRLMCLKNPNKYYGQPASTLWFCFYNNTLGSASSAAYEKFQAMIQSSPWFLERGNIYGTKNKEWLPHKNIRFKIGSNLQHTLGINIMFAMIDEVNFKGGKNIQMEQSKVFEMYTSILGRMQSRFLVNGRCAGMIFLASSKQSEYDFLEKYIQQKKEENERKPKSQRTFYCFDHPQWEVLPKSKYPSGKTFKIAAGNLTLSDKIIEPEEDTEETVNELVKSGYRIIEVPIELYDTAKMGLSKFMMDYAGVASALSTKFFSYKEYEDNISNEIQSPFSAEILKIGLKDNLKIKDFFNPDTIPYTVYSKKLFVHIDTSVSGDRTGISCVAVMGYKNQDKVDDVGNTEIMKELVYRHVFSIAIEAPRGDQISFQKTREFIYYLRNILHWNISKVTTDGFQSVDLRQQLTLAGIPTDYVSLDRTPNGYLMFKQALIENRIKLITSEFQKLLYEEFLNVERNNMTGKIDHTLEGSKDELDSLVGATYSASISITSMDLANMDNFSILMEANKIDYIHDFSDNPVNAMFNMSNNVKSTPLEMKQVSIEEEEKKAKQEEMNNIKELRSHLSEQENRQISNKELLDLYANQFEDDDMIIF